MTVDFRCVQLEVTYKMCFEKGDVVNCPLAGETAFKNKVEGTFLKAGSTYKKSQEISIVLGV